MRLPYIQDPSVNGCAAALISEAVEAIEVRVVRHGVPFFQARAEVLQASADEWVRLYGKETADLASKGVHAIPEREMISPAGRAKMREQSAAVALWALERSGRANSWINRWWARRFGVALYGLAVVAGGLLAQPAPSEAREHSRQRAACSEAREDDAHRRRCWNFDAGDRTKPIEKNIGDRHKWEVQDWE